MSSQREAVAHRGLLRSMRTLARSPGAVRCTNTTRPSGKSATPAPPAAMPRTVTRTVGGAFMAVITRASPAAARPLVPTPGPAGGPPWGHAGPIVRLSCDPGDAVLLAELFLQERSCQREGGHVGIGWSSVEQRGMLLDIGDREVACDEVRLVHDAAQVRRARIHAHHRQLVERTRHARDRARPVGAEN